MNGCGAFSPSFLPFIPRLLMRASRIELSWMCFCLYHTGSFGVKQNFPMSYQQQQQQPPPRLQLLHVSHQSLIRSAFGLTVSDGRKLKGHTMNESCALLTLDNLVSIQFHLMFFALTTVEGRSGRNRGSSSFPG